MALGNGIRSMSTGIRTNLFPDQLMSVMLALTPANQENHLASYDDEFYLMKKETLPNGEIKVILKNKKTNEIIQR